ncbi:hypothetical protein [Roseobacter sp. N2S]|uniref:hypothetical protein n=1 Tax=Roseobacter sp. N2S TaxID=2663844 RepID=UPI002867A940|nr:hypothetical protein [Roseobacter sp. N2S]MDR6267018.1 hypothetical protein [Roseobacter sp. N2S]
MADLKHICAKTARNAAKKKEEFSVVENRQNSRQAILKPRKGTVFPHSAPKNDPR